MSHFAVLVKIDSQMLAKYSDVSTVLEHMLAPYQENNMGDCPAEFLEFNDCTEEINQEWAETDQSEYDNFEDYVEEYFGYKWHSEQNAYGYYTNLNAKWDWYVVGGRWSAMLPELSSGMLLDIVQVKNLDVQRLNDITLEKTKKWWTKYVLYRQVKEGVLQKEDLPDGLHTDITFFIPDNLHDMGLITCIKPREFVDNKWTNGEWEEKIVLSFEDLVSNYRWFFEFSTWAVLDVNGWHEKGDMGWWGLSSATPDSRKQFAQSYFNTFIKDEDPETYLVIVDCHI